MSISTEISGSSSGYSKLDEIPFDFSRRRLSVVVAREDGKHILICKGAVEEIFAVCTSYALDEEDRQLDESHFEAAKQQTIALNSDGFRVVAVAYKEMDPSKTSLFRRGRGRSDAARLHRLSRSAEGERPRGDRRAGAQGRSGEGPDRRQ